MWRLLLDLLRISGVFILRTSYIHNGCDIQLHRLKLLFTGTREKAVYRAEFDTMATLNVVYECTAHPLQHQMLNNRISVHNPCTIIVSYPAIAKRRELQITVARVLCCRTTVSGFLPKRKSRARDSIACIVWLPHHSFALEVDDAQ